MQRATTIRHGEISIIFVDFRDCDLPQSLQVIAEATKLIRGQPSHSALILTDFTNSTHDARLAPALNEFTSGNAPHVKASAIIGMTGMKRVVYDVVMKATGRNIPIFDDADKAKEWLIAQ